MGIALPTIDWPWAIILCRYNDRPQETRPREFYEDLFARNGTGGLCDYWRAASANRLDLSGSRVFGWFEMNRSSAEARRLTYPGDRWQLVEWGREAARANGVDLSGFRNVLVIHNDGVDHGAAGNGIIVIHSDPNLIEFGFIAHEMGHGHGLPHSFAANPDFEYGDGWDVMSFATTTFNFPIRFMGAQGAATVGVNARNLEALGALSPRRLFAIAKPDFSERVTLHPLNQPPLGNQGHLVAKVLPTATCPPRAGGSAYTLEFRMRAGWDQAIPENAVVVHEVRANGLSYLHPAAWSRLRAGESLTLPDPAVRVRVESIDAAERVATVRLWDLPEGSLRKEDAKPEVYLIAGGQKRHVTSPQVLYALGRTWADVKSVPDGELGSIPTGAPISDVPAPQTGVQWIGSLGPGEARRWFTYGWPARWRVLWTVMPRTPRAGGPQLAWRVHVERASHCDVTYWITVANRTQERVEFEGRYAILGR